MNEIKVLGTQEFMGKEIPTIVGGFGKDCKVVLASDIAKIHEVELKKINELITNNIDEFDIGVELLDLCSNDFKVVAKDLGFITSNGQKKCYLLSERGYISLAMLMRTDKARKIRKRFIDEYFTMKETINEIATMLTKEQILMLSIFESKTKEEAIIASSELDRYRREQLQLAETTIEEQKPKVEIHDKFMNTEFTFTPTQMAKLYGLSSGRKINQLLNENKICYKQGKSWMPYATTNQEWYKVVVNEFGSQLRFTSLGVIEISKVLELDIDEKELENVVDN